MKRMTNDQNGLVSFFQAFAERAYGENDLSDVTYALCRSDEAFMQFFLNFFFGEKISVGNVKIFEREHSEDMGRPDFWIETKDGKVYIIEVKIRDWKQHFEQYHELLRTLPHPLKSDQAWGHLGYIANYKVTTTENGKAINENCQTRTWQEFKEAIEKRDCLNNQLVTAYVQYLKSICHFYEIKIPDGWKIRGEDFKCFRKLIGEFDRAIRKTNGELKDSTGRTTRKWKCKVHKSRKPSFISQFCFGEFFELENFDKKGNSVWGWLGAYYADGGINICVEFEDRQGWGAPVCDKIGRDKMEDEALRFWIGKNATEDVKIDDFFRKVISIVVGNPPLVNEPNADIEFAESDAKCFKKEALSMECLPYVLETQLLSQEFRKKLEGKGYMMELSECEDQWCYCGRSFVLKPIISGKVNNRRQRRGGIDGWLGVVFKYGKDESGWGENKNAKGDSLKDFPTFVVEMDKNYLGKRIKKRSRNVIWYEDDYGYGCHDIYIEDDGLEFNEVLKKARKTILDTLTKQRR